MLRGFEDAGNAPAVMPFGLPDSPAAEQAVHARPTLFGDAPDDPHAEAVEFLRDNLPDAWTFGLTRMSETRVTRGQTRQYDSWLVSCRHMDDATAPYLTASEYTPMAAAELLLNAWRRRCEPATVAA